MDRSVDLLADFEALGGSLRHVLLFLDDPDSKLNGSDAAALGRERRLVGEVLAELDSGFDRIGELRVDYDRLGEALSMSAGGAAATVVRERRMMSVLLEQLESPEEVPFVDEVGAKRVARSVDSRPAARRRKSR